MIQHQEEAIYTTIIYKGEHEWTAYLQDFLFYYLLPTLFFGCAKILLARKISHAEKAKKKLASVDKMDLC